VATSNYSIKDLENLTGIKAHTIRIWEKRYKIVNPQRTSTNIRYYTDNDLKKILNVSILNRHGYKISTIANLPNNQLNEKIININNQTFDSDAQVESLIVSMIDLDEKKFEKDLNRMIINLGFEETFNQVLIPFFEKVGVLWQIGTINPGQEHFMTNLIRQKTIVAIDGVVPMQNPDHPKTFVLYLPEGELHEIGLLFYSYLIQKIGHKVIYLGQMVPFEDLIYIVNSQNPYGIVTFITSSLAKDAVSDHVSKLSMCFSDKQIFVSGHQFRINDIPLPDNIHLITNSLQLKELLQNNL
jgi:MerR family transcriptional regulator, light-induced transcriptional regulator